MGTPNKADRELPLRHNNIQIIANIAMRRNGINRSAQMQELITTTAIDLAQLPIELNVDQILFAYKTVFEAHGVLVDDVSILFILITLDWAKTPAHEVEATVVEKLTDLQTKGAFSKILASNLPQLAPYLHELYRKIKSGELRTGDMPIAATPSRAEVLQKTAKTGAMGIVSAAEPTPVSDSDDGTDFLDMASILDPRPTDTLDQVITILRDRPQHQEVELVEAYFRRNLKTLGKDDALKLVTALNDPSIVALNDITRNPAWAFLWTIRRELWERADLEPILYRASKQQ